jgi:hypothetical protein
MKYTVMFGGKIGFGPFNNLADAEACAENRPNAVICQIMKMDKRNGLYVNQWKPTLRQELEATGKYKGNVYHFRRD